FPVAVMLLLAVVNTYGQTGLPGLSDEGVRNYPGIKARLAERESFGREVNAAKAEDSPRVTAQHQYTYGTSNSRAGAFYPNPAVISPAGSIRPENIDQAVWGSYTSIIMEWNVFNFGKVASNITASKKARDAADANFENELLQHKVKIADAYLLTLMYRRLAVIQELNLQRAQTFSDAVNAGVRSGLRAGVDSSLASAELSKAKLLLLQAVQERRTQALRLQELTGVELSNEMELDSMSFLTALPLLPDTGDWQPGHHPLLRYYQLRRDATQTRSIA